MNITKKLVYTLVSTIALQAAVPAHASIWSSIANTYSSFAARVQNMSTESKRTIGFVAAGVAAFTAVLLGTCTWYKKNKKQAAAAKVKAIATQARQAAEISEKARTAQAEEKQLQAYVRNLGNDVERLKKMRDEDAAKLAREQEEARAGLAASAVRQQEALAKLQEEEKKTTAQKATEVAVQTAAALTNGIHDVVTSPTVVNGLSATGAAISHGVSTVASTTAALATSTAKAMGNGALAGVEYATRQEKTRVGQLRQLYSVYSDAFNKNYNKNIVEYEKAMNAQDYKEAGKALGRIDAIFQGMLKPLFEDIKTEREKYIDEEPTIGHSKATIAAGISEMTGWVNGISGMEAAYNAKKAEFAQALRSRGSEKTESKRAS